MVNRTPRSSKRRLVCAARRPRVFEFRRCLTHPLARAAVKDYASPDSAMRDLPVLITGFRNAAAGAPDEIIRAAYTAAAEQLAEWSLYSRSTAAGSQSA
jgi:hypothetical protein